MKAFDKQGNITDEALAHLMKEKLGYTAEEATQMLATSSVRSIVKDMAFTCWLTNDRDSTEAQIVRRAARKLWPDLIEHLRRGPKTVKVGGKSSD
tara:strand:- start:121 stop:405 length:285 start_codon:yes stop_codon:yes gene_type:complete